MEKLRRRMGKHSRVPKRVRNRVLKRDGYKCVRCGSPEELTMDHVHPVRLGATMTNKWNIRTLCWPCHKARNRGEWNYQA